MQFPQNAQTTQKPTGLRFFEFTEWPTLRDARIHRNECLRRHRQQTMLNLGDATQAINSAFYVKIQMF